MALSDWTHLVSSQTPYYISTAGTTSGSPMWLTTGTTTVPLPVRQFEIARPDRDPTLDDTLMEMTRAISRKIDEEIARQLGYYNYPRVLPWSRGFVPEEKTPEKSPEVTELEIDKTPLKRKGWKVAGLHPELHQKLAQKEAITIMIDEQSIEVDIIATDDDTLLFLEARQK